ncbi:MAG: cytochrome c [Caulobacteraceae bacterium]|nr:cytochrome c [Caulobacteraceae bacterium]
MARMGKWGTLAIVALGVTALGSTVVAQDKTSLVKDRQAFMKAQAADNKAINDYAKGIGAKADAEKAIADLQARNPKILALFVPGTSSTDMPGVSNAKAVVWTDHDKFAGVVATLKGLEAKQAELIKTGTPEAVGAAQADLGKNGCGACHGTFREKLPG